MTGILLFCIAQEAKPIVHQFLALESYGYPLFYLVESRAAPTTDDNLKQSLREEEPFKTEFDGASPQECQEWAMEKFQAGFHQEQDLIAIVDKRSAEDSTLLIQQYNGDVLLEFGRYGQLPPRLNTWFDFRVHIDQVNQAFDHLENDEFEAIYPVYYGHKEQLTDVNGVFNVQGAMKMFDDMDPSVFDLWY